MNVLNLWFAVIGSRELPAVYWEFLMDLSEYIVDLGGKIRSGGARGSDTAAEEGAKRCHKLDSSFFEIWMPYMEFQNKGWMYPEACMYLDSEEEEMAARALFENKLVSPARAYGVHENVFMLWKRNIFQIEGRDGNLVSAVFYYAPETRNNGKRIIKGGTRYAVNYALAKGIPCFNVSIPEDRDAITELIGFKLGPYKKEKAFSYSTY